MIRVLGIDPGSRVTGFGIIEYDAGKPARYLGCGCIRVEQALFSSRLKEIFQGMNEIIERYQPQQVAIEQVFVRMNVSSALKLGQARGAAITACVNRDLPVYEYTPTAVKQAIVGHGHADKQQMQHMVSSILKLSQAPSEDAADALGIALCHMQTVTIGQRWQAAADAALV